MPIYEYHCPQCQQDQELLIRGQEAPICPKCGSSQLTKLLSVPAAHSSNGNDLPVCGPPEPGTCGRPECGSGGCQGF